MQTPSKGRIVLVLVDPSLNGGSDAAPAIITRVLDDGTVNVRAFVDGSSNPLWIERVAVFDDYAMADAHASYSTPGALAAAFWPPKV